MPLCQQAQHNPRSRLRRSHRAQSSRTMHSSTDIARSNPRGTHPLLRPANPQHSSLRTPPLQLLRHLDQFRTHGFARMPISLPLHPRRYAYRSFFDWLRAFWLSLPVRSNCFFFLRADSGFIILLSLVSLVMISRKCATNQTQQPVVSIPMQSYTASNVEQITQPDLSVNALTTRLNSTAQTLTALTAINPSTIKSRTTDLSLTALSGTSCRGDIQAAILPHTSDLTPARRERSSIGRNLTLHRISRRSPALLEPVSKTHGFRISWESIEELTRHPLHRSHSFLTAATIHRVCLLRQVLRHHPLPLLPRRLLQPPPPLRPLFHLPLHFPLHLPLQHQQPPHSPLLHLPRPSTQISYVYVGPKSNRMSLPLRLHGQPEADRKLKPVGVTLMTTGAEEILSLPRRLSLRSARLSLDTRLL
eukprot:m.535728 g.535728  ORF g.535728 m.535728 type:complete len:418 (-) comp57620_c0_seq1:2964-4217(-)